MKQVEITAKGGPGVLKIREVPAPALTPDGVRIAVKAAGINFADLQMRMGMYPEAPPIPFVPGYEVAGTISEVGANAGTDLKVGDRVVAGCRFGGYVDEIVQPAALVRRFPAHLSFEEAASIPVNWMTAWLALCDMSRVRAGDRVLVPSAAGGVGVAAVQVAKAHGAFIAGLVGSESKKALVRDLGADVVWTNEEWESQKYDLERFDIALDAQGGKSLKRAYSRLKPTGRVVAFGVSSMVQGEKRSLFAAAKTLASTPIFLPIKLMMANRGVFGLNMLQLFEKDGAMLTGGLDKVLEGFASKRYRAVVGKAFPLADAGIAQEHLRSRSNVGKVVLTS